MKHRLCLFLLSLLLVTALSDALSSLRMDLYDAPTLGGWVVIQYDTSDITDPDTELDTLPVAAVELQTIG